MRKLILLFFTIPTFIFLNAQQTFTEEVTIRETNDDTGLEIDAGNGENSYVDFLENGVYRAFIYWDGSSDLLRIWAPDAPVFIDPGNSGVGIGTSTIPANYSLAVDGQAIFEEVTVQLSGSWPDYVFQKEYPLKSLKEIAEFISHNKHLPNIPSAKEVKENGIRVGEMNTKLLEKVEELYLHLIDMDRDVTELRGNISSLKEENSLLKAEIEKLLKK